MTSKKSFEVFEGISQIAESPQKSAKDYEGVLTDIRVGIGKYLKLHCRM